MSKILVAYFSATGRTKEKAEIIAKEAKADLFEITPKEKYSGNDLNWSDNNSRCVKEHKKQIMPEIAKKIENMNEYEIIFLGYPIWWGTAPNVIKNFLMSYDFSNKIIIPFYTSGGTPNLAIELHKLCSTKTKWKMAKMINLANNEKIQDWVRKNI